MRPGATLGATRRSPNDYAAITVPYRRLYASVLPTHLRPPVVEHARLGAHLLGETDGVSHTIVATALAEALLLAGASILRPAPSDDADATFVRALQAAGRASRRACGPAGPTQRGAPVSRGLARHRPDVAASASYRRVASLRPQLEDHVHCLFPQLSGMRFPGYQEPQLPRGHPPRNPGSPLRTGLVSITAHGRLPEAGGAWCEGNLHHESGNIVAEAPAGEREGSELDGLRHGLRRQVA